MKPDADINDRIAKCEKILETDPNSQIFAALADALRRKGELDRAFRICQDGLRVHARYASAHVVMAKINLDRGLYDWAEAEVQKAMEIEGRSRTTELLLAEIYIYKGEFQDAVKLLRKLHLADPENEQIKNLLDISQKLPEEQAAMLESKIPATPGEYAAVSEPAGPSGAMAAPVQTDCSASEIVGRAVAISNIDGALFLNVDGLVVEAEWAAGLDAATCAAAMTDVRNVLDRELVRASFGHIKNVLIETPTTMFYIVPVADGMFLFLGNAAVNLGTLRMKVAPLVDKYHVS